MAGAGGFSAEGADRWRRADLDGRWLRVGLVSSWLAAMVTALVGGQPSCTPDDPSICGPDLIGAWTLGLALALPFVLVAAPLVGCLLAVLFAVLDLAFDPERAAHLGFGVLAVLCATVALTLVVGRRRQRELATEAAAATASAEPKGTAEPTETAGATETAEAADTPAAADLGGAGTVPPHRAGFSGWGVRAGGALLLVLIASAMFGWYRQSAAILAAHQAAARRVEATVQSVDAASGELTVDAAPGIRVPVVSLDAYRVGTRIPILLDTSGPVAWLRPVAEPEDVTAPLSLGCCGLVLAVLLGAEDLLARRARGHLMTGQHPAVRMICRPDAWGRAVLRATPHGPALAVLPVVELPRIDLEPPPCPEPQPGTEPSAGTATESAGAAEPGEAGAVAEQHDAEATAIAWRAIDVPDAPGRDPEARHREAVLRFGRLWRGEALLRNGLVGESDVPGAVGGPAEPAAEHPVEGAAEHPDGRDEAIVLGRLQIGGWVAIVTPSTVLLPTGRLRPPGSGLFRRDAGREVASGGPNWPPGIPVSASHARAATGLPDFRELPLVLRPRAGQRLLGLIGVLAGPAALLLTLTGLPQNSFQVLILLVFGANVMVSGWARMTGQLEIGVSAVVVTGTFRTYRVPWQRLHGVRRTGTGLLLAWEPDQIATLPPLQAHPAFRPAGAEPGPSAETATERAGMLMMRLRERAVLLGDPGQQVSSTPTTAVGLLGAYLVLALGVLWRTAG